MPPFYRWRRRPFTYRWRRRRRPAFRRRIRQTIRRRAYRRHWVRRRRYLKRLKRKLKKVTVKQWQPYHIRKCTIKGNLLLLACGQKRINHNFTLFAESIVPKEEPGGGGWSIMQLTLRALYDEYKKYRNWWTTSNQGLPLVKYLGCQFKFYRSAQTDYIVTPQLCPPFDVTEHTYLNTQPSRQMMNKHSIIIPRLDRPYMKKPYKKRRFNPPSMFQTKWYFQQDIYNNPFIVLTTVACSLDEMFQPEDQLSYNLTLISLNTDFFQNPKWQNLPDTKGYAPKVTGTYNVYLFTTENGTTQPPKWKDLLPLTNTARYIDGDLHAKTTSYDNYINTETSGNPFTERNIHPDSRYYYGAFPTKEQFTNNVTAPVTRLYDVYWTCRYNPLKDSGTGNKVYFKSISLSQGSFLTLPDKPELLITDFPLWIVFWAWQDWQEKLKQIHQIDQNYQIVIQTPYIYPKKQCYVLLDNYFTQPHKNRLNETDLANWHPKLEMQQEMFFYIAQSGPAAPKINKTKAIEAHCNYKFFLKWGGCPAPMETITDPGTQEKFPIPNNILQTNEIQDPTTAKESYIYCWDSKRDIITETCAQRLKTTEPTNIYFTDTGAKDVPKKTWQTPESSSEEESETSPQEKILNLKLQRHLLKQRLHRLLNSKKLFPLQ